MSKSKFTINGITVEELFDEDALRFVRKVCPDLEQRLPERSNQIPQFEGRENIVGRDLYDKPTKSWAWVTYVSGNEKESDNGWAVRVIYPINYMDAQHQQILQSFEQVFGAKIQWEALD